MTKVDTSVAPYHDDFVEEKGFIKNLYRPKMAVQTRELNQQQTLLQKQIERFGNHVFEEGSMVVPGHISFDINYNYIKVTNDENSVTRPGVNLTSTALIETYWLNKTIVGQTSGVRATVINYVEPDATTTVTLFVRYLNSGTDGLQAAFTDDEEIQVDGVSTTSTYLIPSDATGVGSQATIREGVYYTNGYFVRVEDQTLILDAHSNTPTYRVGLVVEESVVTPEDDSSLYDNVQEGTNIAAPGAHRLKIDLTLTKLALSTIGTAAEEDFIELLRLESGLPTLKIDKSDYSVLETTLARRTFDESGSYTVNPFTSSVREFYNDGSNDGVYTLDHFNYATAAEAATVSINRFAVADPGTSHTALVDGETMYRPGSSEANFITLMGNKLVVTLDPGKAYVEGYENETISNTYVDVFKATTYEFNSQQTLDPYPGNIVYINNVVGLPDIDTYTAVDLRDDRKENGNGSSVGSAKIRMLKHYSGTPGDADAEYQAFLFDIKLNSGKKFRNVRQLQCLSATNPNGEDFTADLVLESWPLAGSVDDGASDTLTGTGTTWFSSNSDEDKLVAGDWVLVYDESGDPHYYQVKTDTTPTSDRVLTLQTTPETDITGSPISYAYAHIYESYNNAALFPMPKNNIRSLHDNDSDNVTLYTVQRQYAAETVSSNQISITTASGVNEEFYSDDASDYVVFNLSTGAILDVTGNVARSNSNHTLTITGLTNTNEIQVIATIRKKGTDAAQILNEGSAEKTKSLVTTYVLTTSGRSDASAWSEISLAKADVYDIVSITMGDDWTTAPAVDEYSTDITDWYELDGGQRDNYYGVGKVTLKAGKPKPTGRVSVKFRYFSHTDNGNYFSADSYASISELADVALTYSSKELGFNWNLRDCLDFRPRMNDAGTGFTGTGAITTEFCEGDFLVDYSYYLSRKDKLYIDRNGNFYMREGLPEYDPKPPKDPLEGMVLYDVDIYAPTLNPQYVTTSFRENKRYTMRDIGKLETRINNLEYYTALSLVEQNAVNYKIVDENGLERYKNGIFTDSFLQGTDGSEVSDPDFKATINGSGQPGMCRPFNHRDVFDLIEKNTTDNQRSSNNYQKTGEYLTLKYDEVTLIDQPWASNSQTINKYDEASYFGELTLDPDHDIWKDTSTPPEIKRIEQEGNYDALKQMADGIGTIYGDWQVVGDPVIDEKKTKKVLRWKEEYKGSDIPPKNKNGRPMKVHGAWHGASRTNKIIVRKVTTTTTTEMERSATTLGVTEKWDTTDLGTSVKDVDYVPFCRKKAVSFSARGLKPSTKVYAFFDDVNVSNRCSNLSPANFITNSSGEISGTFTIPAGTFRTGTRIFSLSSNSVNSKDPLVATRAQAKFVANGLKIQQQQTILSTRNAEITPHYDTQEKTVTTTEKKTKVFLKQGCWKDPVAESFLIYSSFQQGLEKSGFSVDQHRCFGSHKIYF
jgi:hypothetical protein